MTRSIGDLVASTVGVSWEPEVTKYHIHENDRFLIAATDGLWEYLNNKQVTKIVARYWIKNEIEEACDELMRIALKNWNLYEKSGNIDDITFILIFFHNN